jgi:hypothetical protein
MIFESKPFISFQEISSLEILRPKFKYALHKFPFVTYPAHSILFDLTALTLLGEEQIIRKAEAIHSQK